MYNLAYTMNSHIFSFSFSVCCTVLYCFLWLFSFTLPCQCLVWLPFTLYITWTSQWSLGGTAFKWCSSWIQILECEKSIRLLLLFCEDCCCWHFNSVPLMQMVEDGRRLLIIKCHTFYSSAHRAKTAHTVQLHWSKAKRKGGLKAILATRWLNLSLKTHS